MDDKYTVYPYVYQHGGDTLDKYEDCMEHLKRFFLENVRSHRKRFQPDTLYNTGPNSLVLWSEDLPHHGVWDGTHSCPIGNCSHLEGSN